MHPRSSSTGIVLGAVLCTFLFAAVASAQSLWVRPVAGPVGGPGSADGYGSVARFDHPQGVAVTASGDKAFVADLENSTVRKIDLATGAVSTLAGLALQPGSADGVGSAARFNLPYGVAVDANGTTVFVTDTYNCTIRAINVASGVVSTLVGLASHPGSADGVGTDARFNYPTELAVDAAGTTVFVADRNNATIRRVDVATRTVTTLAGMAGAHGSTDGVGSAARFNDPYGITMDAAGTVLYVGEPWSGAIRKIEAATGSVTTLVAGAIGTVYGVATDAAGSVLFATDGSLRIFRVNTSTGASDLLAGSLYYSGSADGTGTDARFHNPYGVAADAAGGTLYVADTENDMIRRVVVATGVVTTQAGRAPAFDASEGSVDGVGSQARFYWPTGVAVDAAGTTAYVAESGGGCAIRQVDLATGTATTLVGGTCGYADGIGSAARFQAPTGIAVTGDGTVAFVADQNSHTIRRIDLASRTVTTLAGLAFAYGYDNGIGSAARFYNPWWVAVDAAGTTVFVTGKWDAAVRMIDVATQAVTTLAGVSNQAGNVDGIGSNARFTALSGIAVDASGANVFVFDNRCVRQVVVATRAVTTLAGSCGVRGTTDGVGTAARFDDALGIATDAAGTRVYVADTVSHTVRVSMPRPAGSVPSRFSPHAVSLSKPSGGSL